MNRVRALLLLVDGAGLVGLLAFSVLAMLDPRGSRPYVIGQIVSIVIVLGCVLLLRWMNDRG
jgi:hypothetical protein